MSVLNHWESRHRDVQESFRGRVGDFEAKIAALASRNTRTAILGRLWLIGCLLGVMAAAIMVVVELWGLALLGVALFVFSLFGIFMTASDEYEHRKVELVRTLLTTFGPELDPLRAVSVDLDFRDYLHLERDEPWLTIQMVLGNGVGVQVQGFHRHKIKEKEKPPTTTPYRPGYTKRITKITEVLTIRLDAPKGRRLVAEPTSIERDLEVGRWLLKRARFSPRRAIFAFASPPLLMVWKRRRYQSNYTEDVPRGEDAVKALIVAYRLVERVASGAAPPRAG